MTPDPYQGNSGGPGDPTNPQSWNRYAYTAGDPVNWNDPDGQFYQPPQQAPDQPLPPFVNSNPASGPSPQQQAKGGAPSANGLISLSLTPNCRNGLATAIPNTSIAGMLAANSRAVADESVFKAATAGTNISWTMLAAIAIRESGVQDLNENDGAGVGVGVFQITVRNNNQNPASGPTASEANNLAWAAAFAANLLNTNMAQLAAKFPNFTPAQLLQATADSYNFGVGNISANPNTMDVGSAHNNYGSNVDASDGLFPLAHGNAQTHPWLPFENAHLPYRWGT